MYDRFTDGARKVMVLANEEARRFNHEYISTEHLLLGLLRVQEGVAARVLINLGLKLEEVREELLMLLGEEPQNGTEPDTPQSRHPAVSGGVTPDEHKADAPTTVRCAVITISDTRTLENDTGGQQILERLAAAGHEIVVREIIPDEPERMRSLLDRLCHRGDVEVILMTGGTGVTSRDQTYETVSSFITKPLPGYGELFRMLSYGEIGPATILSRATGGLAGRIVLLTMPGSRAAVSLAMDKIILPELGHLVREARR